MGFWSIELETLLKYPAVVLVGFLATLLLTPLTSRACTALKLLDVPDARRIHTRIIPRCGTSVFLGFHLACAAVFLVPWAPFAGQLNALWWWHMLVLTTLLHLVGLVDDRWSLRPTVKLLGQVVVSALAYAFGMRVGGVLGTPLPLFVDLPLTVLWFVAVINAFNLVDGIDGLAAGLAGIASIGLAGSLLFRHLPGDALILLGFAGSCLAFLRYNSYPASIFLGDSGSMFLGFVLAAVSLSVEAKGTALATIGVPLLALGIPIIDSALAVWRRGIRRVIGVTQHDAEETRRGRIFGADMDHVHHRLLRYGLSQRDAAGWLHTGALVLVAVGLLSLIYRSQALGIYLVTFVLVAYVFVRHLARVELWDSGRAIVNGLSRPPNRAIGALFYPVVDLALLAGSLCIAASFATPELLEGQFRRFWFDQLPYWAGVPFIAIFLGRAYRRVWSRARVSEFVVLGMSVVGGIVVGAGMALIAGHGRPPGAIEVVDLTEFGGAMVLVGQHVPGGLALQVILHVGLSVLFVLGVRALPRAVQDAMVWGCGCGEDPESRRALVYGAGVRSALFLTERSLCPMDGRRCGRIVGLISEDRNLHGRFVHGHRVFGGMDVVADVLAKEKVGEVIITEPLAGEGLARLKEAARMHEVRLWSWQTQMNAVDPSDDAAVDPCYCGSDGLAPGCKSRRVPVAGD